LPWSPIDLRPGCRFEISRRVPSSSNLRYRVDHVQSHLHAAVSVIGPRLRKSGNAIVTVSEELYPEAVMLGGQPVESAKYRGINSRFGITIYSRVTQRRGDPIRGEGSSGRNVASKETIFEQLCSRNRALQFLSVYVQSAIPVLYISIFLNTSSMQASYFRPRSRSPCQDPWHRLFSNKFLIKLLISLPLLFSLMRC